MIGLTGEILLYFPRFFSYLTWKWLFKSIKRPPLTLLCRLHRTAWGGKYHYHSFNSLRLWIPSRWTCKSEQSQTHRSSLLTLPIWEEGRFSSWLYLLNLLCKTIFFTLLSTVLQRNLHHIRSSYCNHPSPIPFHVPFSYLPSLELLELYSPNRTTRFLGFKPCNKNIWDFYHIKLKL